jgi:hypothetical protein
MPIIAPLAMPRENGAVGFWPVGAPVQSLAEAGPLSTTVIAGAGWSSSVFS